MALEQASELLNELRGAFEQQNFEDAFEHFCTLKPIIAAFNSTPPFFNLHDRFAKDENLIARETYELGLFTVIELDDKEEFDVIITLLLPFYTDVKGLEESEHRGVVMGLYLLSLLVEGAWDEFHAMVEFISLDEELIAHPAVVFVLALDEDMMIGQYNKVLSSVTLDPSSLPHPTFTFFTDRLLPSMRETMAECMEVAYNPQHMNSSSNSSSSSSSDGSGGNTTTHSLTLEGAQELLMFDSMEHCRDFVCEEMGWFVQDLTNGTSVILFDNPQQLKKRVSVGGTTTTTSMASASASEQIPSYRVMEQNLTYANELERIV